MEDYEAFINEGVKSLKDRLKTLKPKCIPRAVGIYIQGYLSAREDKKDVHGVTFDRAREDLVKKLEESLIVNVTGENIKNILRTYGESLTDCGATYKKDFHKWFKTNKKEEYEQYLAQKKAHKEEKGDEFFDPRPDSSELLNEYASPETVAEFCNQNLDANRHINRLLRNIEKRIRP